MCIPIYVHVYLCILSVCVHRAKQNKKEEDCLIGSLSKILFWHRTFVVVRPLIFFLFNELTMKTHSVK